jgi:hypothetical protein
LLLTTKTTDLIHFTRFEVLTGTWKKTAVVWDMMPSRMIHSYQSFGGTCCLHLLNSPRKWVLLKYSKSAETLTGVVGQGKQRCKSEDWKRWHPFISYTPLISNVTSFNYLLCSMYSPTKHHYSQWPVISVKFPVPPIPNRHFFPGSSLILHYSEDGGSKPLQNMDNYTLTYTTWYPEDSNFVHFI